MQQRIPIIPRNVTDLATGQLLVTSQPQQVNYVNDSRIGTLLTNLSSNSVFWGSTAGVTVNSGALLAPGTWQLDIHPLSISNLGRVRCGAYSTDQLGGRL